MKVRLFFFQFGGFGGTFSHNRWLCFFSVGQRTPREVLTHTHTRTHATKGGEMAFESPFISAQIRVLLKQMSPWGQRKEIMDFFWSPLYVVSFTMAKHQNSPGDMVLRLNNNNQKSISWGLVFTVSAWIKWKVIKNLDQNKMSWISNAGMWTRWMGNYIIPLGSEHTESMHSIHALIWNFIVDFFLL